MSNIEYRISKHLHLDFILLRPTGLQSRSTRDHGVIPVRQHIGILVAVEVNQGSRSNPVGFKIGPTGRQGLEIFEYRTGNVDMFALAIYPPSADRVAVLVIWFSDEFTFIF